MAQCKCGAINEYQEEPYVCRDCRPYTGQIDPNFAPALVGPPNYLPYLPDLDAVAQIDVGWAPDRVAIAVKECEIADFVAKDAICEFDRDAIRELNRLRDELLMLRTNPADVDALFELVRRSRELREEIHERAKKMPQSIRDKVYFR